MKRPYFKYYTYEARFWLGAEPMMDERGCWEWGKARDGRGYGVINGRDRGNVYVHRLSWEIHNGPIPKGLFICHHCDNPPCCNPKHLFLGTAADNSRDMKLKKRGANGREKRDYGLITDMRN